MCATASQQVLLSHLQTGTFAILLGQGSIQVLLLFTTLQTPTETELELVEFSSVKIPLSVGPKKVVESHKRETKAILRYGSDGRTDTQTAGRDTVIRVSDGVRLKFHVGLILSGF